MQTVLASENTLGPDSSNALPPLAGCYQCFPKAVARGSWYRRTEGIQQKRANEWRGEQLNLKFRCLCTSWSTVRVVSQLS